MSFRLLLTVLVFSFAGPLIANNNYYLPGDAFFYFEIDQSEWEELQRDRLSSVRYDRPSHLPVAFCGYAGYLNLDLTKLSDEQWKRLKDSIREVKKAYPSKIIEKEGFSGFGKTKTKEEINKIRIFVYNKTIDFSKHRIGLKYNESWPNWAEKIGHRREHFQFDFFVASARGITESWRMGSVVESLDAEFPPLERGKTNQAIPLDPLRHHILVAPPVSFESLAFPSKDAELECFLLTADRVTRMVPNQSHWKLEP